MIGKARRNALALRLGNGRAAPCRSAPKKSLSPAPISEPCEKRQRPRLGWTTKASAGKRSGARTSEVGSSSNGAISSNAKATVAKTGTARTTATETSRASQARTRTSRAKSGTPGKGILSRTLFNDDRLKVVGFGFAQGEELSEHTASMPAILLFLQGR